MRDLRKLIELWGTGNAGGATVAEGGQNPTAGARNGTEASKDQGNAADALFRDKNGRVWVRAKPPGECVTWPADVPEAAPPTASYGVPPSAWVAIGRATSGVLYWPVGTVAHVTGPRLAGLTLARWLARQLQARPECSPVRYLSARELPADSWHASPGAERTLIIGDVVGALGRPRLTAVGELIAGRGRRSVVVVGDAPGSGDEWASIATWLRNDGARKVLV